MWVWYNQISKRDLIGEWQMEITFASVDSVDHNRHILSIKTEEDETIKVGQMIQIQLTDETFIEREIVSIRQWHLDSHKKSGKWIDVDAAFNGESCEVDVYGINGYVQTTSMPSPAEMRKMAAMINIMPYKEINGGEESIYDHINESFAVPQKVIAYLQTTQPYLMCMGVYDHPFKKMQLLGPYWYTDGEYYWDRDAWKYVLKYHVTLPQEFIDKVMSEKGTAFLEECAECNNSWSKAIRNWKEQPNTLCLMPDDTGDCSIDSF